VSPATGESFRYPGTAIDKALFEDTLNELDAMVADRCIALAVSRDLVRCQAGFHWWPKRVDAN